MPNQARARRQAPAAQPVMDPAAQGGNRFGSNADQIEKMRRTTTDPQVVREDHVETQEGMSTVLTNEQAKDVKLFRDRFEKHQARYERVAAATGVPAPLIAAIHWRESHGDFGTYLHQGDPLGKAAVNHPTDIPIFTEWEPAAIHAIKMKSGLARSLQMEKATTDLASMATYAEFYNGLGYRRKGDESPYVYSGTDKYTGGKYVADGQYSSTTKDRQVGVIPLIESVDPEKQG